MLRWTAQLLPPEYLGSHIASGRSHVTGRIHDLGFRAGTALFGHLGIEWDLALASEREMAELKAWIAFYIPRRHSSAPRWSGRVWPPRSSTPTRLC
jgi:alpha-galactosidase